MDTIRTLRKQRLQQQACTDLVANILDSAVEHRHRDRVLKDPVELGLNHGRTGLGLAHGDDRFSSLLD